MTRKVMRSEAADEDMLAIVDDLAGQSSIEAALALDEQLDSAIESLAELSDRGRLVPELRARGTASYREIIVSWYRIIYRVAGRKVWIVAVLDHRRDLDTLLRERARRDLQLACHVMARENRELRAQL